MPRESFLRRLWRNIARRGEVERELDDELRAYVDLLIADHVRAGMSESAASRLASIETGGVEYIKDEVRDVRLGAWFERLRMDVRYASRTLAKNPAFTIAAVATLALGIGANTAIFSLLDAVLLRDLPFREAARLVVVRERRDGRVADGPVSGHEYAAWREGNRSFEDLTLWSPTGFNLTGGGEAEAVPALRVAANFFSVFGVAPLLGRGFIAGEDQPGGSRVVLLSNRLWQRRFGASPSAIGSQLLLDDVSHVVIGVMPPMDGMDPEIWVPLDLTDAVRSVGRHNNLVVGRLKPGVSLEQAHTDLAAISQQLVRDLPEANTGHGVRVSGVYESIVGDVRRPVLVAFGAVAFVLLIACANVAHLQLARAATRQREIAVRGALGASRGRLVRQMLTESLLLSALGGALGLLLAFGIVTALPGVVAAEIPRLASVSIDGRVVAASIALVFLTGLVSGVVPAIRGSRPRLHSMLTEGVRVSDGVGGRLSGAFVVSEVALALILCIGAALTMRSFERLTSVSPGFEPVGMVTASIDLPASRYSTPSARLNAARALFDRLTGTPGVRSASAVTSLPLGSCCDGYPISVEGRPIPAPGQEPSAVLNVIGDNYFRTMQIPLQSGRWFQASDARLALPLLRYYEQQPYPEHFDAPQPIPVAIVSASMAMALWPGENPVGRRFRALLSPWLTVVGVAGDVRHAGLDRPFLPDFYLPLSQEPRGDLTLVVRTTGEAGSQIPIVREAIRGFDRNLPIANLRTLDDVLGRSVGGPRFNTLVLGAFGAVALALSLIGTYGVISYGVTQRLHEIGVRSALGAGRRDVLRLVLGRAMRLSIIGICIGLVGALALTNVLRSLLYEVSPTDPGIFVGVATLLVLVSLLASYLPARRAMRVNPLTAMKRG